MNNKSLRSYCHPVDASVIRVLSNPVTHCLISEFVKLTADANFGSMLASGVPVNENSFPQVNALVDHCVEVLRIRKPYVVVSSSAGFNAFTMGSDENPGIVIGSMLINMLTNEQLLFVIGHECGHIAMGHVVYTAAANLMKMFATNVPVIGDMLNMTAGAALNAWSRRSEISADRAGLLCCADLSSAQKALLQLELGFADMENTDLEDYVKSSENYLQQGLLRKVGEYSVGHPLLPKRIKALDMFMNSSLLYRICGQTPPDDAITDRDLCLRIEKLIRVIG